jgi:hypothetical protein
MLVTTGSLLVVLASLLVMFAAIWTALALGGGMALSCKPREDEDP